MIASFLIALREGIEAALIVAIILSYLKKVNAEELAKPVYVGAILGVLGSIAVGALFLLLSVEFEGAAEQVFEGSTMLLAAAILTTMILWMSRNSKEYSKDLKSKVERALTTKQSYGLAGLAFVSIVREGIETVLFLGSTSFTSDGIQTLVGGSLGLVVAVLIGVAIVRYSVKMDMRRFFNATGILLMLFAAGLVANSLGEFSEAGLLPPIVDHVWDSGWILNGDSHLGLLMKALFGYSAAPSLTQIIGYAGYWVLVIVWIYSEQATLTLRRVIASFRHA
jgi:high-affinity iron transporter